MKKLSSGFAAPLILVIIGLIVGIGITFAYFQLKPKSKPLPESTTTQTASQSSPIPTSSTALANENANWKTYSDSIGKFSLKYPQDWNITNENNRVKISDGNNTITLHTSPYPSIDFNKLYEKPDGTVDQNPVFIRTKIKNLEIDGYKATIYSNESAPANQNKGFDVTVYIIRGAPLTMISAQPDSNSRNVFLPIFEQILSTIKFP